MNPYAARRARVVERLGDDGALLVCAAPELVAGGDTELRYLPGADLYYLTGYTEPEAVLVICPAAEHVFTLFVRARDPERERWTGRRGGVEAARAGFGADAAYPVGELAARLPALIAPARTLFLPLETGRADVDAAVRAAIAEARRNRPRTGRGVTSLTDARALLAPMRVRKDEHELALMREAARITVAAFDEVKALLGSARGEWEVEAELERAFRMHGALGSAFPPIVAGGPNATVLHYIANDAPLARDALVLIDAGARHGMYCADVTRTWPVSDTSSGAQRAVSSAVRAAYDAALACAAPGRTHAELEDAGLRALVHGMRDLGLLSGSLDELIEKKEYRRYFPHRISHWLGLDVHDVGDYVVDDEPVPLAPGMVLTIEPGLYIPLEDEQAPAAFRGIGVRLEDDVLVTEAGHEVLTAASPF